MNVLNRRGLQRAWYQGCLSLAIGASLLLSGCVYDPVYYGPPAHADYHPHYYDYYYYPSVRVYFHFSTGYYYYYHRERWSKARTLPPHIHINARDRVRLRIDSDVPYKKHREHTRKHLPPSDYRIKKEHSLKEREANRRWYKEYEHKKKYKMKKPQQKKLKRYKR